MKAIAKKGQQKFRPIHGMTMTPTWRSWREMLARCKNPNNDRYARYGGRGIAVCDLWLSFENFYADMGDRPEGKTLDRINNDGNYEPSNCRWADRQEQQRNTIKTRYWVIDGIPYVGLGMASQATGLHTATLQTRFRSKNYPNYIGPLFAFEVERAICLCVAQMQEGKK